MSNAVELPRGWPDTPPLLISERLTLRAFRQQDASAIHKLFSSPQTARMASSIPVPFHPHAANGWISCRSGYFARGQGISWAVVESSSGLTIGDIGLFVRTGHENWEIGYAIMEEFAGNGYATEASRTVMQWGASTLGFRTVTAGHFADNPASGRVLQKTGFVPTGESQMWYSLARGEKSLGLSYIWTADDTTAPSRQSAS